LGQERGRVWAEREMATRAEAERGEEFWPAARTERGGVCLYYFIFLSFIPKPIPRQVEKPFSKPF